MSNPIAEIKYGLLNMAFQDIKRASFGKAKMGAFILASCFIDYMAGYRYNRVAVGRNYKDFVEEYLPATYDKEKLYKDLRCKLVHNYSEGGSYWFTDGKPLLHGKTDRGKIIVNLENFLDDLESAMNKLFQQIDADPIIQQKAIGRYNSIGILGVTTVLLGSVAVSGAN
jgi:hypothetical protein